MGKKFDAECIRGFTDWDQIKIDEFCEENFKVNAMQVLDPTLLVPQCRYVELIGDIPVRNGIMEYILDLKSNEKRILEYIGNVYQMPIFSTLTHIDEPQYSVEQWLAGFRDASFIVTDRFHACVSSILFLWLWLH